MACSHCGQNHSPTAHARYGCDALAESHAELVAALKAIDITLYAGWLDDLRHARTKAEANGDRQSLLHIRQLTQAALTKARALVPANH